MGRLHDCPASQVWDAGLYDARPIYSPDVGTGIQPYVPVGIAVAWQTPGGPVKRDYFPNTS